MTGESWYVGVGVLLCAGVIIAGLFLKFKKKKTQALENALDVGYKPYNVGNDASARPWEYAEASVGNGDNNAFSTQDRKGFGDSSDVVLELAKERFEQLQQKWEKRDFSNLAAYLTPECEKWVKGQIQQLQETSIDGTDLAGLSSVSGGFLTLNALIISPFIPNQSHEIDVEFTGLMRSGQQWDTPTHFREIWRFRLEEDILKNNTTPQRGISLKVDSVRVM